MYLINAHGPDHGLSVEVSLEPRSRYRPAWRTTVTIRQWGECCEPDEHGSYSPHVQEATVDLRTLLTGAWHVHGNFPSMRDRLINAALNYLGHWGGEENYVDDDDRPCQHFGSYWGRRNGVPYPDHMTCATCGAKPE